MNYNIVHLLEEDLAKFLLNPFERTAYFNDLIIQKLEVDSNHDDFMFIDDKNNTCYKKGFVLYEQQKIILERMSGIDLAAVEKAPFIMMENLKKELKDKIKDMLEKEKSKRMDEIKSSNEYAEMYKKIKNSYSDPMTASELGAVCYVGLVNSVTDNKISLFVSGLIDAEILSMILGSSPLIDKFIDDILSSTNFLVTDIIYPELEEKIKANIAEGKLTARQEILKDFINKTKHSGAQNFTVETFEGEKHCCKNEVNQNGKVVSVDGRSFVADVEDIKSVNYWGTIIYERACTL